MTRDRRGFTLVELIVVAVLGALVIGAVLQVLIVNQRTYTAQAATVSGQQSTRMTLEVLFNELREASPRGGDIIGMGPDSLRLRLMRKFGVVCGTNFAVQPVLTVVRISNIFGLVGSNMFEAGDSVFVFADNQVNNDDDDVWFGAQVSAVDPTPPPLGPVCPTDLTTPAALLTFNGQGALFSANLVGIGAPVRSFETYTFGDTLLFGDTYFARREGTGRMVPVAGPIRASGGLAFVYRDSIGGVTTNPLRVRQIEVTVRTGSGVLSGVGDTVSDSITALIYTRN